MMDYHAIHGHDIASFDTAETRQYRYVAVVRSVGLRLRDRSAANNFGFSNLR